MIIKKMKKVIVIFLRKVVVEAEFHISKDIIKN